MEDFLAVEGEVGITGEEGGDGVGVFAKPLNSGGTGGVFDDLKAEVGGFLAEVVFCGGEDAFVLFIGVLGDEQADAGGGDDAD